MWGRKRCSSNSLYCSWFVYVYDIFKNYQVFRNPFSFLISPYYTNTTLTVCRLRLVKKLYDLNIDYLYLHQIDYQVFSSSTVNPAFKSLYQFYAHKIGDNHIQKLYEDKDKWRQSKNSTGYNLFKLFDELTLSDLTIATIFGTIGFWGQWVRVMHQDVRHRLSLQNINIHLTLNSDW